MEAVLRSYGITVELEAQRTVCIRAVVQEQMYVIRARIVLHLKTDAHARGRSVSNVAQRRTCSQTVMNVRHECLGPYLY